MNKKNIAFAIVGIIILAAAALSVAGASKGSAYDADSGAYPVADSSSVAGSMTASTTASGAQASTTVAASYSMAEVSVHNNRADCWTAIGGNVYDVTLWIAKHPGGSDAIISLCGIDGSVAFSEEHGTKKRPASELAAFKIGLLK